MARSQLELQAELQMLVGTEVAVYFQPPTTMKYPCVMYEPDDTDVSFADNVKYEFKRGYTLIVMDRNPNSSIPDAVETMRYSRRTRFYRKDGLNHFVFQLYY